MSRWSDKIVALQAKRDEINKALVEAMAARDARVCTAHDAFFDLPDSDRGFGGDWKEVPERVKDQWRAAVAALDVYDAEHEVDDAEEEYVSVPSGSIEALNAEHLAHERGVPITDSPFVERG